MIDHDQRFKLLLQEFFGEFIHLFFPQWADDFDYPAAEWLNTETFLDPPDGERRVLDLVVKLPLRQGAEPLRSGRTESEVAIVHVEVEARDSAEDLRSRMQEYVRQLHTRHRLPVLPIALLLNVGLDGVGWDDYDLYFRDQMVLKFRYAYIGLPALDAFDYVAGPNVLGVALAVLMKASPDRRAELKAEAMERVATSAENTARRYMLCECVQAYLPLEGPQLAEFEALLLTERFKEARMLGVTSFEKGLAQGLEQGLERGLEQGLERGLEQGLEKGREQGLEQGQRNLLLIMLEGKFGPLGAEAKQRLDALPREQLPAFGQAILRAASLSDLGLGPAQPH